MMKLRAFYCQEGHPMSSPLTNTSDADARARWNE
jgi:hypothetical protein